MHARVVALHAAELGKRAKCIISRDAGPYCSVIENLWFKSRGMGKVDKIPSEEPDCDS